MKLSALGFGAAVFLAGCGGAQEVAERSLDLAVVAGPQLVAAYRLEQEACLALPRPDRQPCVDEVRGRWAPIKDAYGKALDAACAVVPEEPSCKERGGL